MSVKEIKAVVPAARTGLGRDLVGIASYDFPDSVEDYVSSFGEDIVRSIIEQHLAIKIQALMRGHMVSKDAGGNYSETGKDLQSIVSAYKPGAARERMSPVDKALSATSKMSDEEVTAFLQKLKEKRKAAKE